jgi:hypothetical protein
MIWEYKTFKLRLTEKFWTLERVDTTHIDSKLNDIATDGWELVTYTGLSGSHGTIQIIATFKRPK